MAATGNAILELEIGDRNELPVAAAKRLYRGSLAFADVAGRATDVLGAIFLGHVAAEANNSAGGAGAVNVLLHHGNYRAQVSLSSVALTSYGAEVYASDNNTLTLDDNGGANTRVGRVMRYVAADTAVVEFRTGAPADADNHEHTGDGDGGLLTSPHIKTGIQDLNGNEILDFGATAEAVNEAKISNAATGAGPVLEAVGETNVDLTVKAKGTGALKLGVPTGKLALFGGAGAVQQNHIADGKTDYTTGDLDLEAEIIAAFNTTNGKINAILAALEAYEALKTS